MANGRPKPAFFLVMFAIVAGLIYYGVSRFSGSKASPGSGDAISPSDLANKSGAEAPDANSLTTVKEYNYVASTKLPEVKGTSAYEPMTDNTVRMALNVWAGWAPVILANNGFKAAKVWKAPGGKTFKLELVLIDDPVAMRDAYASGKVHLGWATLDMVPLFVEQLRKDSRTMPRVYQQIDWSNGGDGIVCRNAIKSVADLRGKTVVLAQNSPSHFFLLNTLISGGLQPGDVQYKFTQDAFQAAAAFNADKSISCAVSWAPDIYNLADASGNKMLVIVMGRRTFEKVLTFDKWYYGKKRVVVVTNHPIDLSVAQARGGVVEVTAGSPAQIVDKLSASGARRLYVDGGITIQEFLRVGLIQRLIISRLPVLIGSGIPLFGSLPRDIRLSHIATRTYQEGMVQSEYRVVT